MFNFLKDALSTLYTQVRGKVQILFSRKTIDPEVLQELEKILITADTGVTLSRTIIKRLQELYSRGEITDGTDLKKALQEQLITLLTKPEVPTDCTVYLLVGINGSGKTTFAGKLAHYLKSQGRSVLLVAADTFRAAATEQLATWAKRINVPLVTGKENQDPASVVFEGCAQFNKNNFNALIIDTAGRLQTKAHLMKELEKIKRTITRLLPESKICTLLTIDAMLGQNSLEQAKVFHESTHLDGTVLTKVDGTGKGGIVFAIAHELHIPVVFISHGEAIDNIKPFDPQLYVSQLLGD